MGDVIDDGTWQISMDTLIAAARLISALPLDKMLRTTEVADSIGPILHPSEYLRAIGQNNWEGQKALIAAAIEFRNVHEAAIDAADTPADHFD